MRHTGPPAGLAPARLFRIVLATPRPVVPLTLRLAAAPEVALSVRALLPREEEMAYDGADDAPLLASGAILRGLVAASLLADGAPAFAPDEVGGLSSVEFETLGWTVLDTLGRISPSYARSDLGPWMDALTAGAREASNWSMVRGMAACVERDPMTGRVVLRPDRYFGLPIGDLTDGHWMAFRAGCEAAAWWTKKAG